MNQFTIYALGEDFDVDAYVAQSSLRFERVWHRGDQLPTTCITAGYKSNGCSHELGDGFELPIWEQEAIADEFLRENGEGLRELRATLGVTALNLGLLYPVVRDEGLVGFCMGPSLSLMWAAVSAHVELTYYVELLPEGPEDDRGDE